MKAMSPKFSTDPGTLIYTPLCLRKMFRFELISVEVENNFIMDPY